MLDVLKVTPCVGVWIETTEIDKVKQNSVVTPCVGVWIETFWCCKDTPFISGHTLRGCVD